MNKHTPGVSVLAFLVVLAGCPSPPPSHRTEDEPIETVSASVSVKLTDLQSRIHRITQSEHMLQQMSGKFKDLARIFRDRSFDTSFLFNDQIEYAGISNTPLDTIVERATLRQEDLVGFSEWPLADSTCSITFEEVWAPITHRHNFVDSQIGVLRAKFNNDAHTEFTTETKFEGRIILRDGRPCGVKAWQTLTWNTNGDDEWKLAEWKQTRLTLIIAKKPLFRNVTNEAFPDPDSRSILQRSPHQEMIVKRSKETNISMQIRDIHDQYSAFSDWECTSQYPSSSVVDYDNDGDDDLLITDRWSPAQLMQNQGDGSFRDCTKESGLSFDDFVNCGYFFDYDNDGDADLLVGYSVRPSKFFDNVDGKFVPNKAINKVLEGTRAVVSIASTDVNQDGLLDLYLCTYASPGGPISDWIQDITRPEERVKTRLRIERSDRFVDRGGPPNILLMNHGGTFEWAKFDTTLKQYRCSYQASWTDLDDDGDPDLYVCNDFSPDVFLRNDTPAGSATPKFVDVTKDIAPSVQMGFGMGASFGDFDNDADLDLYVSNMYSKAGNRIIEQLQHVDERLPVGARGNFLYENSDGKFTQIAGEGESEQHVNQVGWSFGGQFADFDNDGHMDLFVPSGFYSAPKEISTNIDL